MLGLASTGKLRQVIDRVVPLTQVNETLQALQRGEWPDARSCSLFLAAPAAFFDEAGERG